MDDGFNVCTLDSLDKSFEESFTPIRAIDDNDAEKQPFSVTSLISNKLVLINNSVKDIVSPSNDDSSKQALKLNSSKPILSLRRVNSMFDRAKCSPDHTKPVSEIPDFTSPVSRAGFKRPENPCIALKETKKPRNATESRSRSCSVSRVAINNQIFSNTENQNLTADGIQQLVLPTVLGSANNRDLNNIDCHALADLMNGKYDDKVETFRIIDARYVYEFVGGHIRGAENFGSWNEEEFLNEFLPDNLGQKSIDLTDKENCVEEKRKILIFHCEFSSVRGPGLLRCLRNLDRTLNKETYPALHYPECYLLHAGYKEFFNHYPELCEPRCYVKMADPKFAKQERHFHKKSKTWTSGGSGTISKSKVGIKRRLSCEDSASPCAGKKSLIL